MKRKFKHLTLEQRKKIETMYNAHVRVVDIAEKIGVTRNTIYNELKRGSSEGTYSAEKGQRYYEDSLTQKGRDPIIPENKELQIFIRDKILNEGKSPKSIERELQQRKDPKLGYVGYETIYTAIRRGYIPDVSMETLQNNFATIQKDKSLYLPKWFLKRHSLKHGQQFEISVEDDKIILKKLKES